MRHIQSLGGLNPTDLRAAPDGAGGYTVYEPGDPLPPFGDDSAPAAPLSHRVTAAEYRDRFTASELQAILASEDAGVRLLVLKVSTAPPEGIDLLGASVQQGLAYLVTQGLLSADRPAQICA